MKNKVTILATSDLHGHLGPFSKAVLAEKPDIVVLAGDVTTKSSKRKSEARAVWAEFTALVERKECAGIHFVIIPGNHDAGSRSRAHKIADAHKNVTYISKKTHESQEVKGVRFMGGTSYHTKAKLVNVDVCVFHKRPFEDGRSDEDKGKDVLKEETLAKAGFPLILHGHYHSVSSEVEQRGETKVINVSSTIKDDGTYGYYMIALKRSGERWCVEKAERK